MNKQFDFFEYPYRAGFKENSTSRDNAKRIEESGRAPTLRERVRVYFELGGEATADELAIILEQQFRSIQPRLSELRAIGFIKPTGERRRGSGGGDAHVWRKA
jgi:hypothetical protein